jgi:arylsulfatase A-like enzyme
LIADDMGFGDPGCNNPQSKIPMPHLDNLAADGLRFIDTHTPASVTTKSET